MLIEIWVRSSKFRLDTLSRSEVINKMQNEFPRSGMHTPFLMYSFWVFLILITKSPLINRLETFSIALGKFRPEHFNGENLNAT